MKSGEIVSFISGLEATVKIISLIEEHCVSIFFALIKILVSGLFVIVIGFTIFGKSFSASVSEKK